MKRGNISNRTSPAFLFNLDTLLFDTEQSKSLPKSSKSFLYTLTNNQEATYFDRRPNKLFIAHVNSVFYRSDYNVYMITYMDDHFTELYKLYLKQFMIPFSRIIREESAQDVRALMKSNPYKFQYYFDLDVDILSIIGDSAISFNDISKIVL